MSEENARQVLTRLHHRILGCHGEGILRLANTDEIRDALELVLQSSEPRPWLRAEEVRESGSYWQVCNGVLHTAVQIKLINGIAYNGHYGAGINPRRIDASNHDYRFQRIPEPELPKEERS